MADRLPPLTALRAFEATARHSSIKKAAEELHVTPAAVGYQVKSLERHLGCRLFERFNRGLRLTESGHACLPEIEEAFALLSRAVSRARQRAVQPALVVSAAPVLAVKWLAPRLDRFLETHPGVELRIDTTGRLVDLEHEADIAVRFSAGRDRGLRSDLLFRENVSPVCSPALCEGPRPIRIPEDLRGHALIHVYGATEDKTWPGWTDWLKQAGVKGVDGRAGSGFNQAGMAIEAAAGGQGVALAGYVCVADDLAAGRLIRPFGESFSFDTEFSYHLVSSLHHTGHPEIETFRKWVLEEAERDNARQCMRRQALGV